MRTLNILPRIISCLNNRTFSAWKRKTGHDHANRPTLPPKLCIACRLGKRRKMRRETLTARRDVMTVGKAAGVSTLYRASKARVPRNGGRCVFKRDRNYSARFGINLRSSVHSLCILDRLMFNSLWQFVHFKWELLGVHVITLLEVSANRPSSYSLEAQDFSSPLKVDLDLAVENVMCHTILNSGFQAISNELQH